MCGINLILDKQNKLNDNQAILRMNQATHHRGPDFENSLCIQSPLGQLFFGHNRLKIIDLSNSANQPFSSTCGNYTLIYNGEIYNYKLLQQQLKNKYLLKTSSDTEVLLYWLIEHSDDANSLSKALNQLNGMFAFVFWDNKQNRLLVARDPHSIKPLYYANHNHYLIISSEIRGILTSGLIPKKLNNKEILSYLRFKYALRPNTFFEGVYEFEESALYDFDQNTFQKLPSQFLPYHIKPKLPSSSDLETTLRLSLKNQIQADVPVGIFLSGGVDSTLLLALWSQIQSQKVPAFSIINTDKEASFGTKDYLFARKAAEQFQGELTEITVNQGHLDHLAEFWKTMDQPVADGASYLTHLLAEEAIKSVKVVLSGAGADEWFGGYNRHWALHKYLQNPKIYAKWAYLFRLFTPLMPDGFAHPLRKQFRLLKKFSKQIHQTPMQTWMNFMQMDIPIADQQIVLGPPVTIVDRDYMGAAFYLDRKYYLASDILKISDEMTMRHGLELRVPFLDNHIIQMMKQALPSDYLLKNGKKWLLKEILNHNQGQMYTQRKKEGFGMPFGYWLKKNPNHELLQKLHNSNWAIYDFVSYQQIQPLVNHHLKGKSDYSQELWALLALGYWLEAHF